MEWRHVKDQLHPIILRTGLVNYGDVIVELGQHMQREGQASEGIRDEVILGRLLQSYPHYVAALRQAADCLELIEQGLVAYREDCRGIYKENEDV